LNEFSPGERGPRSVAVIAFAASQRGWPEAHPDLRAVYSRQVPALLVDWLDGCADLAPGLAVFTVPLPPSREALAWVMPERMLEPSELMADEQHLPDAEVLVDGNVHRRGGELEIQVRVIQADTALVLAELEEVCAPRAVVPTTLALARGVAAALDRMLPPVGARMALLAAEDRAVDLYMLGRDLDLALRSGVEPGTELRPAGLIGRALALSPRFGPAADLLLDWAHYAMPGEADAEMAAEVVHGLERATANAEADPRLWSALGLLRARWAADPDESMVHVQEAIAHGGDSVWLRMAAAESLLALGRQEEARHHLSTAAASCPDDPLMLDRVAALLGNSGDVEGATALWRRGAELAPWDGRFFAQLGRAANARGDHDRAWEYYWRALLAADLPVHVLAYMRDQARVSEVPERLRERALRLQLPDSAPASVWLDLGELCLALGERGAAPERLRQALQRADDEDTQTRICGALLEAERPGARDRIQSLLDRGVEQDPRAALKELDGFLTVAQQFWPVWFLKGLAEQRLEQAEAALLSITRAVELAPRQVAPWRVRAGLLLAAGRGAEAEDALRRVVALLPRDLRARVDLALLLRRVGRGEEALAELEAALRIDPGARRLRWLCFRLRLRVRLSRKWRQLRLRLWHARRGRSGE
jgi:tetratricopeptide (TPR) repeat protein